MMKNFMIIARGAEAVIERDGDTIIKRRIKKGYRIPVLDEYLRKKRTRNEARLMIEAKRNGIRVPDIIEVDEKNFVIKMKFIEGKRLSEYDNVSYCKEIGEIVKKLHEANIIHGDLTTSNLIESKDGIYLIDFSLGFFSNKIEDKAVDLILLKRAIETRHRNFEECWKKILEVYSNPEVISQMKKIEKRWRYHK